MTRTLFRGTVRTGAGDTHASAVRDGRVVALGSAALALDADLVVEPGDGLLLPAFGDGHAPCSAASNTSDRGSRG